MAVDVNIRRVGADETGMLRDISISTFTHTYSAHNTPENMRNYIEESFGLERFAAELKSALTQYYFAERGSEILGYLKLNFGEAQTNHSLAKACEIERIYVVSKYQGLKIGKLLLDTAIQCTRDANLDWLWLGVWDRNQNALGFYERTGFEKFGKHDFTLGTEAQSDLLMRLPVSEK